METIGWISSVALAICAIPQGILVWRNKNADGMSAISVLLWLLGEITGIIYAISIVSYPLIFNYTIGLTVVAIINYYKFKDDIISLTRRCYAKFWKKVEEEDGGDPPRSSQDIKQSN